MTKESLKYVFLLSFIAVLGKCLYFSFDFASVLCLLIAGGLLFAYDFIQSNEKLTVFEKRCQELADKQEVLLKEMQILKSASSLQKMGPLNSKNPFPPRLS